MTSSSFIRTSIFLFLLSCGLLFSFVIPPFQNPDEPQHFDAILRYGHPSHEHSTDQTRIIQMMDDFSWWKYIGSGRPESLSTRLSQLPFLKQVLNPEEYIGKNGNRILYHAFVGKLQNLLFKENIVSSYHFCRILSFFLVMASFGIIILTFKKLSVLNGAFLLLGPLFILFISQLIISALSVNPDSLSILLGSVYFYAVISLMLHEKKFYYSLLLILSTTLGIVTDNSNLFMIISLFVLPFFLIRKDRIKSQLLISTTVSATILIILAWVAWYSPHFIIGILKSLQVNRWHEVLSIKQIFSLSQFKCLFLLQLFDSTFLKFGWMAFGASGGYYTLWRTMAILAGAGVLIYAGTCLTTKIREHRLPENFNQSLKIASFSLFVLLLQILALWLHFGTRNILPQGRYMFALVVPISFLFILGVKTLFDVLLQKAGKVALAVFILVEFFLFNLVVWNDLIPVFHLTIKSPHPGI